MIKAEDLIRLFQQALAEKWGYIWGKAGFIWTEKAQENLVQYMVNNYGTGWKTSDDAKKDNRYNSAVYGSQWIGKKVADCSGLFSWAFKELGSSIPHGSNSIYDRCCTEKGQLKNGRRSDGGQLLPGMAVFTGTGEKHGHIGLYVGDGKVIEANGAKSGVITSKVTDSKWTYWGRLKNVEYTGSGEDPDPIPVPRPTIKRGAKGEIVKRLQNALLAHGYVIGSYGADGIFGKATEEAVKKFQQEHTDSDGKYLVIDGICGPKTWAALERETVNTYTITISGITKDQASELLKMYPTADVAIEGR